MIGQSLAHYQITDKLGQGGMGAVYRAHDAKLDRDVALKLLPDEFARDPERLARFRREAKVLASLNHSNIAAIHGLEEDQGKVFLIMELADGEDLAHRLKRGAFTVDETLSVARQLAEGLEQAHERGVVHRDLKPANVMMSAEGAIKILDFGLARAYAGESAEEGELANSPTITAAMTLAGTILGTAAYMSPEQARGKEVDRRADIWAFGVMLHEMLTGQMLFEGETISDTLAGVLKTEPDLEALPPDTPVALRWLIERCLQKQPSARLRDIGEARILLQSDLDQLPASTMLGPGLVIEEKPRWLVPALVGVAIVALALGALGMRMLQPAPAPPPTIHASLLPPVHHSINLQNGGHLALSPDGQRLAFAAADSSGQEYLWVRRLDSGAAHQLTGTQGASYPFWSPDGEKIGFFTRGSLRKIDAAGGVAATVCNAEDGRGGSWTQNGRILFTPGPRRSLFIVSAGGGEPSAITRVDSTMWTHRWPEILPDDDHYLYTVRGDAGGIYWASLGDTNQTRLILPDVFEGRFASGRLLFGRDEALWARPFDPATGEFLGEETLLAESVRSSSNFVGVAYSVSSAGTLVYADGSASTDSRVGVYDLETGQNSDFVIDEGSAGDPSLSPDGRYLALAINPTEQDEGSDIWIRDLQRGTLSRLTTDEEVDDPVWAPSQDRIVYATGAGLVIRSTVGTRAVLREIPMSSDVIPHDWSRDGEQILYSLPSSQGRSIWIQPTDEGSEAWVLVTDDHFNVHPSFSPDGAWITYMSMETGDAQIYLREVSPDGGTWQVTSSTSFMPRFDEDGDRVLYLTGGGLSEVTVEWTPQGPEFGAESMIMELPFRQGRDFRHHWCLSQDGKRLVAFIDPDRQELGGAEPLHLVVGWQNLLGEK